MKTPQISRRVLLSMLGASALTGCGASAVSFRREAGAEIDEGGFGNATARNTAIHTGELGFVTAVGEQFAREVPTTVNFAFNSARLSARARQIITQQAQFMRLYPQVRFSVYGHADAPGSNAVNDRLGRRRASAVVRELGRNGIERSRLAALISRGENDPLVPSAGREPANRRAVTEVGGIVQGHPLVLDGNYALIPYRQYIATQ